jgi:hypothetical protein
MEQWRRMHPWEVESLVLQCGYHLVSFSFCLVMCLYGLNSGRNPGGLLSLRYINARGLLNIFPWFVLCFGSCGVVCFSIFQTSLRKCGELLVWISLSYPRKLPWLVYF